METPEKQYTYELATDSDSNCTLKVKIANKKFVEAKEKLFKKMAQNVTITGFRPGKGPKGLIEARLGPDLYEKTLNELLPQVTLEIIETKSLEPLTHVKYEVEKVSEDEGVEYHAHFVVYPDIKLGNFQKIKIQNEKIAVSKEEINTEKKRILDLYNQQQEKTAKDKTKYQKLETITNEVVESLKIGIKTVEELEKQIIEQVKFEKENQLEEKKIKTIITEAIQLSKVIAPKQLVIEEVEGRGKDYKYRIEQLGLKMDDFLKAQNTTEEDLRKQWEKDAIEKIASELLLFEIVKTQKIVVTIEEIDLEVAKISDPKLHQEYDSNVGRRTISAILSQQKAIKWLKDQVNSK
ncbi:MAG: trigger factor [bacterium]